MAVITLTINDEMVSAQEGQSLLSVLHEHDIDIPTLCHLEGLSERGGCRLCMVEMEGSNRLQAACVTPVAEGMVVSTHSDRLVKYRKMILEMLFAERNHVCAACVMNGHCELQGEAAKIGMDHVRYEYLSPDLPMDASHPHFVLDHNRCILCTRCVRVCDEIEGAHVWDVMGRGVNSRVIVRSKPAMGQQSELHKLRQMCSNLSDRCALYQRVDGRRDGETAQLPTLDSRRPRAQHLVLRQRQVKGKMRQNRHSVQASDDYIVLRSGEQR